MIAQQVVDGGHLTLAIECDPWLGQGTEKDAPVAQHAMDLAQSARGILEVLKHMTGNDKIHGRIGNPGQILGISDVADRNQIE
jgi:hypothetical protein